MSPTYTTERRRVRRNDRYSGWNRCATTNIVPIICFLPADLKAMFQDYVSKSLYAGNLIVALNANRQIVGGTGIHDSLSQSHESENSIETAIS